jgi:uncharacterized protein YrrD
MQFRENADVRALDGQKIGSIDRVVVDPASKEVTHLVIKKGILFSKDKVLPVDRIATTTEEEVILKPGAENPEELHDFEEEYYIRVNDLNVQEKTRSGYVSPIAWYHRYPGTVWWSGLGAYPGYVRSPYVRATQTNIPPNTVPLEEGAKVIDPGGETVGKVESIYVEPDERLATHLLVESGMLSKSRKIIPTRWINSIAEGTVRLTIDKDFFERLPEHSEVQ